MKKIGCVVLIAISISCPALAADFTAVDADQNGTVSMEEAKAAMPDMQEDAFKSADLDGNIGLSKEEFLFLTEIGLRPLLSGTGKPAIPINQPVESENMDK